MGMKFTEDQQRVIDLRNCNILVSAAAGSGKTAVLVERIVELVSGSGCDSARAVDIDRLLIVTFTNAAAAQMRERITKALSDRVEAEPDNEHIKKQLMLIHNAKIMTIHSFCLYLIKNHLPTTAGKSGWKSCSNGYIPVTEAILFRKNGCGSTAWIIMWRRLRSLQKQSGLQACGRKFQPCCRNAKSRKKLR